MTIRVEYGSCAQEFRDIWELVDTLNTRLEVLDSAIYGLFLEHGKMHKTQEAVAFFCSESLSLANQAREELLKSADLATAEAMKQMLRIASCEDPEHPDNVKSAHRVLAVLERKAPNDGEAIEIASIWKQWIVNHGVPNREAKFFENLVREASKTMASEQKTTQSDSH